MSDLASMDPMAQTILKHRKRMLENEGEYEPQSVSPGQEDPSNNITGIQKGDEVSDVTSGGPQSTGDADTTDIEVTNADNQYPKGDDPKLESDGVPVGLDDDPEGEDSEDNPEESRKDCSCSECGYMGEAAADGKCPNCGSVLESEDDEEDDEKGKDSKDDDDDKEESLQKMIDKLFSEDWHKDDDDDSDDDEEDDEKDECNTRNRRRKESEGDDSEGETAEVDPEKYDYSMIGATDIEKITDTEPMTAPQGESRFKTRIPRYVERVMMGEDVDQVAEDLISSAF